MKKFLIGLILILGLSSCSKQTSSPENSAGNEISITSTLPQVINDTIQMTINVSGNGIEIKDKGVVYSSSGELGIYQGFPSVSYGLGYGVFLCKIKIERHGVMYMLRPYVIDRNNIIYYGTGRQCFVY